MSNNHNNESITLFQNPEHSYSHHDSKQPELLGKTRQDILDEEKESMDRPFRPVVTEKKHPYLPYFLDNIVEGTKALREERKQKRSWTPTTVAPTQPEPIKDKEITLIPTEIAPSPADSPNVSPSEAYQREMQNLKKSPREALTHQQREGFSELEQYQQQLKSAPTYQHQSGRDDAHTGMQDFGGKARGSFKNTNHETTFGEQLEARGSEVLNSARGVVEDLSQQARNYVPSEKDIVRTFDKVSDTGKDIVDNIRNNLPSGDEVKTYAEEKGKDAINTVVSTALPKHKFVYRTIPQAFGEYIHDVTDSIKQLSPFHKQSTTERAAESIRDAADSLGDKVKELSPFHEKTMMEKAQDYAEDTVDSVKKMSPFHEKTMMEKAQDYAEDTVDSVKKMSPFHEKTMMEKAQDYIGEAVDAATRLTPSHEEHVMDKIKHYVEETIDNIQGHRLHNNTTSHQAEDLGGKSASSAAAAALTAKIAQLMLGDSIQPDGNTTGDSTKNKTKITPPSDVDAITTNSDDVREDFDKLRENVTVIANTIRENIQDVIPTSAEISPVTQSMADVFQSNDIQLPHPRQILMNSLHGAAKFCIDNDINLTEVIKENVFPQRANLIDFYRNLKGEYQLYRTKNKLEKQWGQTKRDISDAIDAITTPSALNVLPPEAQGELKHLIEAQDALKEDICTLLDVDPKKGLTTKNVVNGVKNIISSLDIDKKDIQPIALSIGTRLLDKDHEKAVKILSDNLVEFAGKIGDGKKIEQAANVFYDVNAVYNRALELFSTVAKESPQIVHNITDEVKTIVEQVSSKPDSKPLQGQSKHQKSNSDQRPQHQQQIEQSQRYQNRQESEQQEQLHHQQQSEQQKHHQQTRNQLHQLGQNPQQQQQREQQQPQREQQQQQRPSQLTGRQNSSGSHQNIQQSHSHMKRSTGEFQHPQPLPEHVKEAMGSADTGSHNNAKHFEGQHKKYYYQPGTKSNPNTPHQKQEHQDHQYTTDDFSFAQQQQVTPPNVRLTAKEQLSLDEAAANQRKRIVDEQHHHRKQQVLASLSEVSNLQIFPPTMSSAFTIMNAIMKNPIGMKPNRSTTEETDTAACNSMPQDAIDINAALLHESHKIESFLSYHEDLTDRDEEFEGIYIDEFTDLEDQNYCDDCEDSDDPNDN